MKKSQLLSAVSAVLFALLTISANASLVGRLPLTPGGTDYQAAYDDVLEITWLTNAGLSSLGNWDNRVGWADGLDTANYLGVDGWRLASMDVNSDTAVVDCDGATELACRDNELGYMYWQNMGGTGSSKTGDQTVDGVLLTDVQSGYWSGSEFDSSFAWSFGFGSGFQGVRDKNVNVYGWAVRSGDVSAVPVPAAVWLFGSGLIGLVGLARRKKA
jgi:hypothetical protein